MKKKPAVFITLLSVMGLLAGCASKASDAATELFVEETTAYEQAYESYDEYDLYAEYDDAEYASVGGSSGPSYVYSEKNTANTSGDEAPDTSGDAENYSEKLVYTCNVTMETTEFDKTLAAIKAAIKELGGFIQSESASDSAGNWYYSDYKKTYGTLVEEITVRIPSENYEQFLNGLNDSGKITNKDQSVENITKTYYDTATTIKSLETQEERLLKMMKEAETIEDMLAIEDRLSEVQNELSIYKSRLSQMDTDVDYSTVCLYIKEVLEYTPDDGPVYTSTFADRLKNTLSNTWEDFKEFLENALFFLIQSFPVLLILGLVNWLVFSLIVKSIRKKRAKKAAAIEVAGAEDNLSSGNEE